MATQEENRAWTAIARRLGTSRGAARKHLRSLPEKQDLEALEADPPRWLIVARARVDAHRAASRRAENRRRRLVDGLAIGRCGECQGRLITCPAIYDDGCICGTDVGLVVECECPDPERVDVVWCGSCNHIVTETGATGSAPEPSLTLS
jgi:hypothetical protein